MVGDLRIEGREIRWSSIRWRLSGIIIGKEIARNMTNKCVYPTVPFGITLSAKDVPCRASRWRSPSLND